MPSVTRLRIHRPKQGSSETPKLPQLITSRSQSTSCDAVPGAFGHATEIALQGSLSPDAQPKVEQTNNAPPAGEGKLSNPELTADTHARPHGRAPAEPNPTQHNNEAGDSCSSSDEQA